MLSIFNRGAKHLAPAPVQRLNFGRLRHFTILTPARQERISDPKLHRLATKWQVPNGDLRGQLGIFVAIPRYLDLI